MQGTLRTLSYTLAVIIVRAFVAHAQLCRVVAADLLTATFVGQLASEALLVEVGEDVRRVHEDRQRAYQRHGSVDVQQEPVKDQRQVLPVIDNLHQHQHTGVHRFSRQRTCTHRDKNCFYSRHVFTF